LKTYDKLFNSAEHKEKKYQLASGYISTTTVFFEEENITAKIEAKGDIAFFDGEHDRWDSRTIGWHKLTFDVKTKEYTVEAYDE